MIQILLMIFWGSQMFAAEKNTLIQGDSAIINAPKSIAIEGGKNALVKELNNNLIQIQGTKPGTIRYKTNDGIKNLQVLSWTQAQTFKWLKEIIDSTLGLELEIKNAQVVVTGRLFRISDWQKIQNLCWDKTCDYLFAAKMSPQISQKMQQLINQDLQNHQLPAQVLQFNRPVKTYINADEEESESVTEILRQYGVQVQKSKHFVRVKPLIRVTVTLAEIKKSTMQNLGLQLPGSISGSVLPKFGDNLSADGFSLRFLETNGNARVLANPKLLIRSGEQAEFLAGGEFPIKIMNYKMQDVVWKKYGLLLKLKPIADYAGKLNLSIETEISQIDPSRTVDGIPGMFTNRVQSHFDVLKNQMVALSGLINLQNAKAVQGLPALQKIPILGSLFSSTDFLESRTELVVLVYPEVIHPADSAKAKVL
jgi:pilus assembly protein CpaC